MATRLEEAARGRGGGAEEAIEAGRGGRRRSPRQKVSQGGQSVWSERRKRKQEGAQADRARAGTSCEFIIFQQAGTAALGWTGQLTAPQAPNE